MVSLSVITPVLNGERFMIDCLESVAADLCDGIEHLVVDGGSEDRTVEIVRDFMRGHPHVKLLSRPGTGQSEAMNQGIAEAAGDVLGFLNADDFYEPGALHLALKAFSTLPEPSLLVGSCNILGDEGELLGVSRPRGLRLTRALVYENMAILPVNPAAYFYHASLHRQIGHFAAGEDYVMDIDFLLRAIGVARVQCIPETLGNFRLIEGTKTRRDMERGLADERFQNLLEKHRGQLPEHLKWVVAAEALRTRMYFALRRLVRSTLNAFA